jgi:hypothetical protein
VDTIPDRLLYEPDRGGEYLLRLQPELLRGGRFQVTLSVDPALAFPVQDSGPNDIGSGFGADRDGGSRAHHGVDIFAPRGTPALAAIAGVVSRVEVTNLGGKVVWLQDQRRSRRLYYAHLDSQVVARGDRVEIGDTVGFVGNTGNARTTPPHLHFGLYDRGPVDPDDFIRPTRRSIPALTASLDLLGGWGRLRSATELRSSPDANVAGLAVAAEAPVRVLGGAGSWYRVQLPSGEVGYVPARLTEDADRPLRDWVALESASIQDEPASRAPSIADVSAGTRLPMMGTYGDYTFVESPEGRRGWVRNR